MLHSMKRSVAKATASRRGVEMPAEFQDLRSQLDLTKKNVKMADAALTKAHKAWLQMLIDQRNFTQAFSEGYPKSDDDTAAAAADFSAASENIYNHFIRETSEEGTQLKVLRAKIQKYLAEIESVEKLYGKLVEAKSESARYQSKLDTLAKKKKDNDVKKSRNFEKLDTHRGQLEELTAAITAAQKKLLAKSAIAHRVALVAYWHANEMHLKIAQQSMDKTAEFASKNMSELLALDMEALDIADDEVLSRLLSVPSITPGSPSAMSPVMPSSPAPEPAEPESKDVKPSPL